MLKKKFPATDVTGKKNSGKTFMNKKNCLHHWAAGKKNSYADQFFQPPPQRSNGPPLSIFLTRPADLSNGSQKKFLAREEPLTRTRTKKQLGDTAKLKGNSFYGKMIENVWKHMNTKFTTDEKLIDKIFRSPYFDDLEEISEGVFEVRQRKRQVTITRPYQCGIAVYQLAKLRMLEFYYDFVDKFCDRRDFELIQMDTDSFYMALSTEDFDSAVRPEMKELYKDEKKNWLVTDEYSKRVPGLFKPEFKGKRMIALTSKCYFADNGENGVGGIKFSCKGVSRRQNQMSWERYRNALFGALDKVTNIGFRKKENHIVTYEQTKLGLSAYYDKRIVHEDGIHTSCLRAQSLACSSSAVAPVLRP